MEYTHAKDALISIIIPVYNAEKTLKACLESILSQSYTNLELILVDDGSKDNSLALCHAFAQADPRIRVLSQKNAGPAAARNMALEAMKGDLVMFVDSDDHLAHDACRRMADAMANHQLVIGHYFFELAGTASDRGLLSGNRVLDEQTFLGELVKRPGTFYFSALWNKMYLARIIRERNLRFDPFLSWGEDFAFNMQYDYDVLSVALVEEPVYHYIKNPGGASILSLLHIAHSCRIKWKLYQHFKGLFVKKGLYQAHRLRIQRYIYNITLMD